MMNLREKIEKILNELYFETHEVGVQKIMPRNEISVEKATEQILQVVEEMLPDTSNPSNNHREYQCYCYPYIEKSNGFNSCLAQIRERMGK